MSQFVVSARKYRPLRFDDVVGQEHVTKTLKNAIQQDTLAHAFLFCGPRGVGKTTCARILAKVLNCKNVTAETEPCNECESCVSFDKNASLNIIELDAASNNSVDNIRSLVEQVRFQPQEGTYKIFIIDEVHMLSTAAFNAFLKTLEEPPPYAIFILATTEKHKIIPTILSRCQIFDFRRIHVDAIKGQLRQICEQEGIEANEEALHLIATKSDGALRDALSIFDKLASFGGKKVTYQQVIDNLNILDYDYFFRITDSLISGDIAAVLTVYDDILQRGFEGDAFLDGLAEHFRNLLVCHHRSIHHLLDLTDQIKTQYLEQANLVSEAFLLSALDIANDCDIHYRMAKNKRLHVEMALIKINYLSYRKDDTAVTVEQKKNDSLREEVPPQSKNGSSQQPIVDQPIVSKVAEQENKVSAISEATLPKNVQSGSGSAASDNEPDQPAPTKESKPFRLEGKGKLKGMGIGSLHQFVKEVEDKFVDHRELEGKVISLDQVQAIWSEYGASQSSQTVKAVLEKTVLKVVNNAIVATVGSSVSKTVILQELDLIEDLRDKLGIPRLTIKIEIDSANLEQIERPKVLTTKEKYEQLCSSNPQLHSFLQKFGLKPDSNI